MSTVVERALKFKDTSLKALTTNQRIIISREAKELILSLNEIYKEEKDPAIMDLMKELTLIKQKVEKRLKGKPTSS
ncbi:hypothetical protein KCTC32516_02341 [Polaribacter huanghezhanensis]|uniref:hypothetical protein n=1 Tax=Polaribacter huanghezhanensis TaxID=1354726 RepID=UPI002648C547|nr:hypothetical protein [Polaribacter huanghezhanensis]WKD86961.1 hypothetical protein KCTC32516_02341 [Polaribacter huanghezhanensis]